MKKFLTISILCITNYVLSQEPVKIVVSFVDHYTMGVPINNMYNCFKLKAGISLKQIDILATYSYGGQYNYTGHGRKGFNDYNYHQVGGSFKYYVTKSDIFKPFIDMEISTEVGSLFKNGLMRRSDLRTTQQSSYSLQELSQQNSHYFDSYEEYDSWIGNVYYQSTPFSGTLLIGCDVKLCKNLYLNFGLGLGIRSIKVLKPVTRITKNYNVFSADAQLGVSYAFPLKKKITE